MNQKKVNAAKRLVDTLESDFDFLMFLMDHPNAEKAMKRMNNDVRNYKPKPKAAKVG